MSVNGRGLERWGCSDATSSPYRGLTLVGISPGLTPLMFRACGRPSPFNIAMPRSSDQTPVDWACSKHP